MDNNVQEAYIWVIISAVVGISTIFLLRNSLYIDSGFPFGFLLCFLLGFTLMYFGISLGKWIIATCLFWYPGMMLISIAPIIGSANEWTYESKIAIIVAGTIVFFFGFLFAFNEYINEFIHHRLQKRKPVGSWEPYKEKRTSLNIPDLSNLTAERTYQRAKLRKWYKVVSWVTRIFLAICFLIFIQVLWVALPLGLKDPTTVSEQMNQDMADEMGWIYPALKPIVGIFGILPMMLIIFLAPLFLIFGYLVFFVAPILIALPLYLPLVIKWKNPARFLLFRPFHKKRLSRSLLRIIRKQVAPFGHTYTLADPYVKVPWYVRIPILFGQISLFSFRIQRVRRPEHIDKVIRKMHRPKLRILNWLLSFTKIFPLSTTDDGWQACVIRMAQEVNLIFIDISGFKSNVVWEIEQCERLELLDRVIFLVSESEFESGKAQLEEIMATKPQDFQLFAYGKKGLVEPEHFEQEIAKVLCKVK